MKDNRMEKLKQHYTIILNGQNYKVLKHKIDTDKSLLTIKTKIFGQDFPHGENISVSTAEDNDQTVIVAWRGMWKDEKVEHWEYSILQNKSIASPRGFGPTKP